MASQPDLNFQQHVAHARQVAAAYAGGRAAWAVPPWDWSGDVLDVPGAATPFSRVAAGQAFEAVLTATPPGSAGEAAGLALQSDWVAARERAFRARHLTPPREWVHAAARKAGHAAAAGVPAGALGAVVRLLRGGQRRGGA